MDYKQTLSYLTEHLPMYHRIGPAAYKANMDDTIRICNLLGNPQNKFKSIHVAGTNGKGSVSHMLASVLQQAGYKTALYTSPHLRDFRERIRINGKKIPIKNVKAFVEYYRNDFEAIQPSFFEMTVGMAFEWFANENVDIAVFETGLGGRLDATNVITPEVSVITNIGFDHMQFLGDTLQKIATEKAGIIKPGVPVVIGESQDKTNEVFIQKAKEAASDIFFADEHFECREPISDINKAIYQVKDIYKNGDLLIPDLLCDLTGIYQQKNLISVFQTLEVLNNKGWKISLQNITDGLKRVVRSTELLGRWQIIDRKPLTICDCAHNPDGVAQLGIQLKNTSYHHLHFVLGMANDKDVEKVLSLLPKDATYYFCKANIPRGLDANELATKAKEAGLKGEVYSSVFEAFMAAKYAANTSDLVLVSGSIFVVAEVI